MPIVRVDIVGPKPAEYVKSVLAGVRSGVVEGLGVPDDRVTVRVIETPASHADLPACRTDRYTVVEVALYAGRSPELKAATIAAVRERLLAEPGIPECEVAMLFRDRSQDDLSAPAAEPAS